MATRKRTKKKSDTPRNDRRLLKESIRDYLGSGLLNSGAKTPVTLFFLRDALNSRLLK